MSLLGLTLAIGGLEVATPFGDLLGPLGLTVALLTAVTILGRILFKFIDRHIASLEARIVDLTTQRDTALAIAREATAATKSTTEAVERLSELVRRLVHP